VTKKGFLRSKRGVLGSKRHFFSVFLGSKSINFTKISRTTYQKPA